MGLLLALGCSGQSEPAPDPSCMVNDTDALATCGQGRYLLVCSVAVAQPAVECSGPLSDSAQRAGTRWCCR